MSNIPPLLNIIGDRYGMLLVIKEEPPKYYINNRGWSQIIRIFKCKCDCGNFNSVRMGNLRGGSTISCGCQLGVSQKHGRSGTPEHRSWAALCKRVKSNSPKSKKYYKDKGIVVCSRWLGKDGFANFLNDMGKKPSEKHGVERIKNNKGYSPENCIWGTSRQQIWNRSNTKKVVYNGIEISLSELVYNHGKNYNKVFQRIYQQGWDIHRALFEPIRKFTRKSVVAKAVSKFKLQADTIKNKK